MIPFLFLFFSFLSFLFLFLFCFWNSLLLAFPPFLRWFIGIHLPLWAVKFTSPAERAPRIENNSVCSICCDNERVTLETDLKMGSAAMMLVFVSVNALPSCWDNVSSLFMHIKIIYASNFNSSTRKHHLEACLNTAHQMFCSSTCRALQLLPVLLLPWRFRKGWRIRAPHIYLLALTWENGKISAIRFTDFSWELLHLLLKCSHIWAGAETTL